MHNLILTCSSLMSRLFLSAIPVAEMLFVTHLPTISVAPNRSATTTRLATFFIGVLITFAPPCLLPRDPCSIPRKSNINGRTLDTFDICPTSSILTRGSFDAGAEVMSEYVVRSVANSLETDAPSLNGPAGLRRRAK